MADKKVLSPIFNEAVIWRQDLHRKAELALEEHKTSAYILEKLKSFGVDEIHSFAGTGLVGVIKGNRNYYDRSVMLRADMDALPILEETGVPYASETPGIMHACGHDGHMAMLLGAAKYLAATRDFDGTVYVTFQPAEEKIGGARMMIEEGLFKKFPADAVYGMHNVPQMPLGIMGTKPGDFFAAIDTFTINFKTKFHSAEPFIEELKPVATLNISFTGQGGHSANAEMSKDIISAACETAQHICYHFKDIATVTSIETASHATNVMSEKIDMTVDIRRLINKTAKKVRSSIEAVAKEYAEKKKVELEIHEISPPLHARSSPEAVQAAAETQQSILKISRVWTDPATAICSASSIFPLDDINGSISLCGTIRTFDPTQREFLMAKVRACAEGYVSALGCDVDITFGENYPVLKNTAVETSIADHAARTTVGSGSVLKNIMPVTNSEDFAFYLKEKPGNFILLGTGKDFIWPIRQIYTFIADCMLKKGTKPKPIKKGGLHTPSYNFNDKALPIGIKYWVNLVERELGNQKPIPDYKNPPPPPPRMIAPGSIV